MKPWAAFHGTLSYVALLIKIQTNYYLLYYIMCITRSLEIRNLSRWEILESFVVSVVGLVQKGIVSKMHWFCLEYLLGT